MKIVRFSRQAKSKAVSREQSPRQRKNDYPVNGIVFQERDTNNFGSSQCSVSYTFVVARRTSSQEFVTGMINEIRLQTNKGTTPA